MHSTVHSFSHARRRHGSGSSTSATRRRRSSCSRAARRCSPGPTRSARRSPRRTPRRALRPARQRRVDDRRPRGAGVHPARPRRRRRGPRPRTRRPARAPGGHRRRRDGRPGRRARPPGRVLGAHPGRDAARRAGPARRRPARPRRGDDGAGCSRARCPTGPTARPWRSSPPPARRSSATTPPPHARPPSASGTARRARSPRSRWPTRWAWSSPSSTASRAGASACPSSRSRRSSCTVAATRSSRSATARRSRARSLARGCSCSNRPRRRSPTRPPMRAPDLTAMNGDTATNLRAVRDEDAPVMTQLRQHATSPFDDFTVPAPATEQDHLLPRPDQLQQMLVLHGERGVIGTVQWHPVRYGPTRGSVAFNIGITLRPDARGRGHGSRAQALLAQYLFDRFQIHRIEAATDVDNIAEQRALAAPDSGARASPGAHSGALAHTATWSSTADSAPTTVPRRDRLAGTCSYGDRTPRGQSRSDVHRPVGVVQGPARVRAGFLGTAAGPITTSSQPRARSRRRAASRLPRVTERSCRFSSYSNRCSGRRSPRCQVRSRLQTSTSRRWSTNCATQTRRWSRQPGLPSDPGPSHRTDGLPASVHPAPGSQGRRG